jgi:predicted DCC family thiol-disulfide oxidoreductase YuxK
MSSEALVKVSEGKIPIRNEYHSKCELCDDSANPLQSNDPKELRHFININAQWLCEIEEKISKLEAKLNASQ